MENGAQGGASGSGSEGQARRARRELGLSWGGSRSGESRAGGALVWVCVAADVVSWGFCKVGPKGEWRRLPAPQPLLHPHSSGVGGHGLSPRTCWLLRIRSPRGHHQSPASSEPWRCWGWFAILAHWNPAGGPEGRRRVSLGGLELVRVSGPGWRAPRGRGKGTWGGVQGGCPGRSSRPCRADRKPPQVGVCGLCRSDAPRPGHPSRFGSVTLSRRRGDSARPLSWTCLSGSRLPRALRGWQCPSWA